MQVSSSLVYWIFSTKFWSIALKIELAIEEKDIQRYNRLISVLLFGGIAFILVSDGLTVAPLIQYLKGKEPDNWLVALSQIYYLPPFLGFGFLIDALRRLARTKVQNKTISTTTVFFFSLAYVVEVVGLILNLVG